ncbi:TolC family protein [Singulisphaera acidiphila]|nr:TolC family protein [Singulisphaera acidiphila]
MKHVIARAIACSIILLVLPSCGIPPLRKAEPPPGLPESLNGSTSPENSSQLTIEEFYHDPMLTSLICQAVANNRELKILNEDVQIASNQILSRSGAYLPFVTAGAGAGLNRASRFTLDGAAILNDPYLPGQYFSLAHGNFGGGINLTWQLDIYRQLRNARDAAGQRYNVALEKRNYFITRLAADVAENYYRLMALDKRLENQNLTIELQERSLEIAKDLKEAARINELGVLRFQAEVRKNQSEKLIVNQDIVVTENKINFLVNRFPQPVERVSAGFYDLNINRLSVGVPSQLLQNRPDIRQAERDLAATGLDVKVARVNFFPQLVLNGGTGLEAFVINHLFEPQAVVGSLASSLVGPLVNKRAIRAEYLTANARQLQAIYNYQRVVLNAFTEVVNRLSMVEKYTNSIEIKKQQLAALEASVEVAGNLFQNARVEYIDVLFAQRDLRDARATLIDTKVEQLSAIVNTYQALGGGLSSNPNGVGGVPDQNPYIHTVSRGETFRTISQRYYESERYHKALWAANKTAVPDPDRLTVGDKLIIPPADQLDQALIDVGPTPASPRPETVPDNQPAIPPPPESLPSPFGEKETKDPADSPNPATEK